MNFTADDSFLRKATGRGRITDGVVHWRAFEPRKNEVALSYTLQSEDLKTERGIDDYQLAAAKRLTSGDLPGICRLTFFNLTQDINPPLPPRHDVDPDDKQYGHLHCLTDLPPSEQAMRDLATLATVIRDFVRAKRR